MATTSPGSRPCRARLCFLRLLSRASTVFHISQFSLFRASFSCSSFSGLARKTAISLFVCFSLASLSLWRVAIFANSFWRTVK
jgi:hypothetical protein